MASNRIPDLPANTTLQGLSVLVTGSNQGLGYHAALLSLQLGASPVYLAVRNLKKGHEARTAMLADPVVRKKNSKAIVKVYELDMARWDSVKSFAEKFIGDRHAAGEGLDIAMLNAGLYHMRFELAPTGNELTVQVNHLSTALLSLLLLSILEASTIPKHTARLMIVSSGQHRQASSTLTECPSDDNYLTSLNDVKNFASMTRYGLSKMLVIFFLRVLATKVSSDRVIINNVCPGLIRTNLARELPVFLRPVLYLLFLGQANPVERGAACYIHGVTCVGKESHGLWYRRMVLTPYGDFLLSDEGKKMQDKIWTETLQQLEQVVPGVSSNI
ncbi:NADP-binding protein [Dacryopinax primogenitus]|uniref:NADP-binding protein n=1 Tax=Dacryopinax primogenitus (strain DJM 731) TaxID=1858805 RepID=M5G0M1_DACPD|nr:NADP-binding protein [Dacryopinax primogenitus]EJT97347.1 NADP-binding protein [Dacryopinax primogenitus]